MALTTPFTLTSMVTPTYKHAQMVNEAPVKVRSAIYDGAALAAYKGAAVAISDVAQLISIPAGAFVLTVTVQVITAEGGTCTFGIGDGAGTSGWLSAVNGNSTATNTSSFNGTTTPTFGVGKYYSAADTIDVILSSGTAAAVVAKISATYIMTTPYVS